MDYIIRKSVLERDIEEIIRITRESGFFSLEEVDITSELVNASYIDGGEKSGYNFLIFEVGGEIIGFSCYGKIPCTKYSYDLYWIVVDKDYKKRGIGKTLLQITESEILSINGKKIFIETSSTPLYDPTRSFYERVGYKVEAVIKDFYDIGDDKILYVKDI